MERGTAGPSGSTEQALLLSVGVRKGLPDETEGEWEGAGQVKAVQGGMCGDRVGESSRQQEASSEQLRVGKNGKCQEQRS